MFFILLVGFLLIPAVIFFLLVTCYKIPIKYLEEQKVVLSSEVKKKIRNRFGIYAIVVSFIFFILSIVGFVIGIMKCGAP